MYAVYTCVNYCAFTGLTYGLLNLALWFFVHLLNACGMYSAVGNKLFDSKSCYFAANRFKTWNGYGFRCVVDYKVNTGYCFKCAYVSALAADYTSLHLVIGKSNHRNRGFCSLISGTALYCGRDYLTRKSVLLILGSLLKVHNFNGLVVSELLIEILQKQGLSLFLCIARNFFEHIELALFDFFNLFEFFIGCFDLFV